MGIEADDGFFWEVHGAGQEPVDGETFIAGKAVGLVALRNKILRKCVASPAINLFCLAT